MQIPTLPEGSSLRVECLNPECDHIFVIDQHRLKNLEPVLVLPCPKCNGSMRVGAHDNEVKVAPEYTGWKLVLLTLLAYFIHCIITLDRVAWTHADKLCQWLQKAFVVSKWWLAAGFLIIGFTFQVHIQNLWTLLLPLVYSPMIWQVIQKAQRHSEEEGDVLDLKSHQLVAHSRILRVLFLLMNLATPGIIAHVLADPHLNHVFEHLLDPLGVALTTLGFYFLDATYIPPGGRRLMDFSQQYTFARSLS